MELPEAIRVLSDHILDFDIAQQFKKHLPNILLALVSTKIPLKPVFPILNFDACTDTEKTSHLENSIALAILSDHPDILQ